MVTPKAQGESGQKKHLGVGTWPPEVMLGVLILEFVFLVVLFLGWRWEWSWLDHEHWPLVIGDVFPIIVPWAAAMGGVTIGLHGMASHWKTSASLTVKTRDRDRLTWNVWYLLRLPLGMVFGTVGAMITVFIAGVLGTTDEGAIDVSAQGMVVLALIAFVVGYRQQSFEELISRVVDLITATGGDQGAAQVDFALGAESLAFKAGVGDFERKVVPIENEGKQFLRVVASTVSLEGDGASQFDVVDLPVNVGQGKTGELNVEFRPSAAGSHAATLRVTVGGVAQTVDLTGDST